MQIAKRRTEIIYYDCTNFYFEIEEAEDDKQYGVSKENRPLPIVEMGLFIDRDGIPLAFSINPGNENEQQLTEFQARPVYLKRKERIVAHFITCFIALILYRYLEKKLDNRYICSQILDTLQEMNFIKYEGKGYQPTYTRTELTDSLHEAFGFCTSKQIVPIKKTKNICSETKK